MKSFLTFSSLDVYSFQFSSIYLVSMYILGLDLGAIPRRARVLYCYVTYSVTHFCKDYESMVEFRHPLSLRLLPLPRLISAAFQFGDELCRSRLSRLPCSDPHIPTTSTHYV